MSKKYVPSFLKDQQPNTSSSNTTTSSSSTSFWPGQKSSAPLSSSNHFAPLADDYKKEKSIINTSLPAKQAPKLAPATLASLTGNGSTSSGGGSGPKKSFATKFAEQARIAADPNYKPPQKPVDITSENDFPTLGGSTKPAAGAWGKPKVNVVVDPDVKPAVSSFAEKAKEWARKKEEEEEMARLKKIQKEKERRENELMKSLPVFNMRQRKYYDYNEENDEYDQQGDDSSLGEGSYQMDEEDGAGGPSEEEDDDNNGEFNQNVGWDGRRRDDLY